MTGFFRFGEFPQRADTIVVDRHFALTVEEDDTTYVIKGTQEPTGTILGDFRVDGESRNERSERCPAGQARRSCKPVPKPCCVGASSSSKRSTEAGAVLAVRGTVDDGWHADRVRSDDARGREAVVRNLDECPRNIARTLGELIEHEGWSTRASLAYVREHGRLPQLDWFTLVAFAAIAGAGGLANTLFSNYARDKGWGMGARVGAIPSAVGGLPITLSHVGEVFPLDAENMARWKGWMRHILRDQIAIWMAASFIGMALPCMLSLQFIRNATVAGDRVAAMTAEGIAERYPEYGGLFWT